MLETKALPVQGGLKSEGETVCQENVRQVQNCQKERAHLCHLRAPEAQAKAG
jgi:hypothetical protein